MKNFLNRVTPAYDANDDGGGGATVTAKDLKDAAASVDRVHEAVQVSQAKVDEIANELVTLKADYERDLTKIAVDARDAAKAQVQLARVYGKSGSRDYLNDLSKFLRAGFIASKGGTPDGIEIAGVEAKELLTKAAVSFTTTTDATAGYLMPDLLLPGIQELQDIYGNFYPLVTKVTAPAGVAVKINKDNVRPTAYWRGTQASGLTEEATPMSFQQGSIISELLGTYIVIANELLNNPSANFSAVAVMRMVKAINDKLEDGLIKGLESGDEPSDGIIADATSQGSIASMTFAHLVTFLQSCIADNKYAFNPARNKIFMTPEDVMALATEAVGASELTGMLVWGDPRKGVPTTFLGYEVIVHPSFDNGTNKYVMLGDPSTITLVEDGSLGIDYSPHASDGTKHAFVDNSTMLRVLGHYDWDIGITSEWHAAVVTA